MENQQAQVNQETQDLQPQDQVQEIHVEKLDPQHELVEQEQTNDQTIDAADLAAALVQASAVRNGQPAAQTAVAPQPQAKAVKQTSPVTFTKEEVDLLLGENKKLRGELETLRNNFDANRPGIGTYVATGLAVGVGIGVAGAVTYHFLNRDGDNTITLENE